MDGQWTELPHHRVAFAACNAEACSVRLDGQQIDFVDVCVDCAPGNCFEAEAVERGQAHIRLALFLGHRALPELADVSIQPFTDTVQYRASEFFSELCRTFEPDLHLDAIRL